MKTIITSLVAFLAFNPAANADILRCSFTEPFFTLQYSTTTMELSARGPEINRRQRNVSFQIRGRGNFELFSRENRVLATLLLDYRGSDGMSDRVYPYSIRLTNPYFSPQTLHGGCESNFLKATNPSAPSPEAEVNLGAPLE